MHNVKYYTLATRLWLRYVIGFSNMKQAHSNLKPFSKRFLNNFETLHQNINDYRNHTSDDPFICHSKTVADTFGILEVLYYIGAKIASCCQKSLQKLTSRTRCISTIRKTTYIAILLESRFWFYLYFILLFYIFYILLKQP